MARKSKLRTRRNKSKQGKYKKVHKTKRRTRRTRRNRQRGGMSSLKNICLPLESCLSARDKITGSLKNLSEKIKNRNQPISSSTQDEVDRIRAQSRKNNINGISNELLFKNKEEISQGPPSNQLISIKNNSEKNAERACRF